MRDRAESWIDSCVENDGSFSSYQVWVNEDGEFRLYLGFATSADIANKIEWISGDVFVVSETIDKDDILSLLPAERLGDRERHRIPIEQDTPSGDSVAADIRTDIRSERKHPTKKPAWGSEKSSLLFEQWVEESDVPDISKNAREDANEEISDQLGVDMNKYSDHIGNVVVKLEETEQRLCLMNLVILIGQWNLVILLLI